MSSSSLRLGDQWPGLAHQSIISLAHTGGGQAPLTAHRYIRKRSCAIRTEHWLFCTEPTDGGCRIAAANNPSAATWTPRMKPTCWQVSGEEPPSGALEACLRLRIFHYIRWVVVLFCLVLHKPVEMVPYPPHPPTPAFGKVSEDTSYNSFRIRPQGPPRI